jgi:hypothetical protein
MMATSESAKVRKIIDAAIEQTADAGQIARLEVAREYFCNPEFRAALEEHVWQINQR